MALCSSHGSGYQVHSAERTNADPSNRVFWRNRLSFTSEPDEARWFLIKSFCSCSPENQLFYWARRNAAISTFGCLNEGIKLNKVSANSEWAWQMFWYFGLALYWYFSFRNLYISLFFSSSSWFICWFRLLKNQQEKSRGSDLSILDKSR